MRDPIEPRLAKWPFFCGDALFLCAAGFVYQQSTQPMPAWQIAFLVLCVAGGATLGVMPFLLEYRLVMKLAQVRALTEVMSQIKNLEGIAAQISGATGRWQYAQEQADRTAAVAGGIAQRMEAEVEAFKDFMQRASDSEKATLRLEVEKSRRAESDWLQVLIRMLDHVYALHQGALRSGQPNLIEQVGSFQNACRDAARRVGLTPFVPSDADPFDPQRHQLADDKGAAPAAAVVAETIATGYTLQGRLLRPALVRVRDNGQADRAPAGTARTEPETPSRQSQLCLEAPAPAGPADAGQAAG